MVEGWAYCILDELSDNVATGIECAAGESECTVWVGVEEILICSGESEGSRHAVHSVVQTLDMNTL